MKPTIRIVFDRKKQATKTTPGLIQVEIYYNGKRKYISTGIKVKSNEWDNTNKKVKGTPNDANNNYHIGNLCQKIENYIIDCERNNDEFSFTSLDVVLSGNTNSTTSFHTYYLIRLNKRKIEVSTHKKLMATYHHIERFGRLKTFADLTHLNIKEFDFYLSERGLSKTSIYERHKQLKSFINEAIADGYLKHSPYAGLKIPKGKGKEPVFLLENELQLIIDCVSVNEKLQRVKDLFLFQCFTGLAYSDLAQFTKNDIRELDGKKIISSNRQKTDESFISLLLPEAENILIKYDYKLPVISNAKYNDYLKVLAALAGIDKKITTHTARHRNLYFSLKTSKLKNVFSQQVTI